MVDQVHEGYESGKGHSPDPRLSMVRRQRVSLVPPRRVVSLGEHYLLCMGGTVLSGQAQSWLNQWSGEASTFAIVRGQLDRI